MIATAARLRVMKRAAIMSQDDVKGAQEVRCVCGWDSASAGAADVRFAGSLALTPVRPAAAEAFRDSHLPPGGAG